MKWLNWVMDFCNSDIKSVSTFKKLELYFALKHFIPGGRFEAWVDDYEKWLPKLKSINLPSTIWDPVLLIQDEMRSFLAKLVDIVEKIGSGKAHFAYIPLPDLNLKPVLQLYHRSDVFSLGYVQSKIVELARDEKEYNKVALLGIKAYRSVTPLLPSEHYIYNLGRRFDGVPLKWIKKCKGCGKFFLNPTEREKIYCNSSCASRSIARTKRERLYKNPKKREAYRKKMREIMKAKYEASQKAKGYRKITHYKTKES
jgi:hypothetical protein